MRRAEVTGAKSTSRITQHLVNRSILCESHSTLIPGLYKRAVQPIESFDGQLNVYHSNFPTMFEGAHLLSVLLCDAAACSA